ncbi:hypothetical protein B7463_g5891, partial [Scytalidium lignicola]
MGYINILRRRAPILSGSGELWGAGKRNMVAVSVPLTREYSTWPGDRELYIIDEHVDRNYSKTEGVQERDASIEPSAGSEHNEKGTSGTNSDTVESDLKDEAVPHLHAKTILIVITAAWFYFAQVAFIVGCGAFGGDVGEVPGDVEKSGWIVNVTAIFMIVLSAIGFIGRIVLASAHSMVIAILGATIGSIGGVTQSLVHAIASEILPQRCRMSGQAALNAGSALGGFVKLMVGGALTNGNPKGFRTYFYIMGGIYALATVVCVIFYTSPPRELQISLTQKEKLGRLDWAGTGSSISES